MKTLIFFDDWFLDSKVDIMRRFPQANLVKIFENCFWGRCSILWDDKNKCFAMIGKRREEEITSLYVSENGIDWEKKADKLKFVFKKTKKLLNLPGKFPFEQTWFYDKWDKNSNRRYKIFCFPYGLEKGPGLISYSSDRINWIIDENFKVYTHQKGSDTNNNMFFNPFTQHWCIICRKWNADRRIAMVESWDLEHWTEPRVIIHPDPLDESLLQFYGMPVILYRDEYFIGLLQCYYVSTEEINEDYTGRVKMQGKVNAQLVYSYDGELWIRSDRSTIIPNTELGDYGGSGIYPHSIVVPPNGNNIFIYSLGTLQNHSLGSLVPGGYPSGESLILHTLRKDGFVYLEPAGGWGQFTTRVIVLNSEKITLNYKAPFGKILVQITDIYRKPLPDYSFYKCIPLKGDEIDGKVCWKKKKDLSGLIGKPIRLEIRLFESRLYAIHGDFSFWYTNTPKPINRI